MELTPRDKASRIQPEMNWQEWVDLKTWKLLSHHVSAVGMTILAFKVVYWLVAWGFPEGVAKTIIEFVDTWMIVGLLLVFAFRVAHVAKSWLVGKGDTENGAV